jgi:hypothetical protein
VADTVPAIADALRQATSETNEELTRRGALGRAWMKDEFAEERTAHLFMAKVYGPALARRESTADR